MTGDSVHPAVVSRPQKSELESIPPEIRQLVYDQLFYHLCISIRLENYLDISNYPFQITAVSRLLRSETLPILRNFTCRSKLVLECVGGQFPDEVRQRLPTYVDRSISTIIVPSYHFKLDELKPCKLTFPNLQCLKIETPFLYDETARSRSRNSQADLVERFINTIIRLTHRLQLEQERPREGLERDYFAEGSLFEVLSKGRAKRGFNVVFEAPVKNYGYGGGGYVQRIVRFDWDKEIEALAERGLSFRQA